MTTAREETSRLADLLHRERHALAEFLVALASFDRERRWVDLGYRSLFYFLVHELGLSKGAAHYRKIAAELVERYPDVLDALREGKLCLTSIVELSKVSANGNIAEVLPRYFHLSKREAKEVTAEFLPVEPPLRTVVTSVRAEEIAVEGASSIPGPLVHPANLARANSSVPGGAPAAPHRRGEPTKVEPLTAILSRMHVTVSRGLLNKLAQARDALSHSHPGASDETILEVGLDLILQRHAKRRGVGAKPRGASSKKDAAAPQAQPASTVRSRHVPAAVKRAVWERDHGCCAWQLENGGVCGSTRQIEIDHIHGWALGAETTVEECRLLCRFHQDVSARKLYGDDLMNKYTRPKGPTCKEPVAVYGASTQPERSVLPPPGLAAARWTRPQVSTSPSSVHSARPERIASRFSARSSESVDTSSRICG
jgi:5-methylcytosine-specific restriction endonuclease McrA